MSFVEGSILTFFDNGLGSEKDNKEKDAGGFAMLGAKSKDGKTPVKTSASAALNHDQAEPLLNHVINLLLKPFNHQKS